MIVIAGGGTGGHVLPALAIADSIKRQEPGIQIHFVGTTKGIEAKLIPKEGYPIHFLPVSGLKNKSVFARIKALLLIPIALFKSLRLVIKLRPKAVLGVGGYASGPFLLVVSLLGYKTFIWEPNAHPGLTNRWLSRFVNCAFVVFEASKKFLATKNIITLGMPLRKSITATQRSAHPRLRVLVFGGSQGARGINNTVSEAVVRALTPAQAGVKFDNQWFKQVEIVHQTGVYDFEDVKKRYVAVEAPVDVHQFLYDMDKRYAWADLVVCRSGASTVAEIAATHKAAIFIPFPHAADDHQKKNAETLAAVGASILVDQKDFTPEKFISLVRDFLGHPEKISKMEAQVASFHKANASDEIARIILES